MTHTQWLPALYVCFALASAVTVQMPVAHWLSGSRLDQSSKTRQCVALESQNVVCTGDRVLDQNENLSEVREIVSPRLVVVAYPIGFKQVLDYAALSPSVGVERCFDNTKGDAICVTDQVAMDETHQGLVVEMFNNQRAFVELSPRNRELVLVEDLKIPEIVSTPTEL